MGLVGRGAGQAERESGQSTLAQCWGHTRSPPSISPPNAAAKPSRAGVASTRLPQDPPPPGTISRGRRTPTAALPPPRLPRPRHTGRFLARPLESESWRPRSGARAEGDHNSQGRRPGAPLATRAPRTWPPSPCARTSPPAPRGLCHSTSTYDPRLRVEPTLCHAHSHTHMAATYATTSRGRHLDEHLMPPTPLTPTQH
nr:extensin-like [Penaeus vannamei]